MPFDSGDRYEFIIAAENMATKEIQRVKKDLSGLRGSLKQVGDDALYVAKNFAAWTAAAGVAGTIIGTKLVGLASDAEETTNKMNEVFGEAAEMVRQISETAAQSTGASRQEFQAMASEIGNLLVPMGFVEQAAADMSVQMVQLAADLGSFNNVETPEALNAIRSGLVGETEPLRRFGVQLSQARIELEALNMGLISSKKELDTNAKAQAILSIVMKDTAKAQGDFARTADSFANALKTAKAEIADLGAEIGEALLPAGKDFVSIVRDMTTFVREHKEEISRVAATIGKVFVAAIGAAISAIGVINDYVRSAIELWGKIPGPLRFAAIAFGGLTAAVGALVVALGILSKHPIIFVLTGIGIAIVALYRNWDSVMKGIRDITIAVINKVIGWLNWLGEQVGKLNDDWGWHMDQIATDTEAAGSRMAHAAFLAGKSVVSNFSAIKKAALDPAGAMDMLKDKVAGVGNWFSERFPEDAAAIKKALSGTKDSTKETAEELSSFGGSAKKAAEETKEAVKNSQMEFFKLRDSVKDIKREYQGLAISAGKELAKLEQEHKTRVRSIDKEIQALRNSMTELKKGFILDNAGLDKSLAERVVDQEQLIREIESDIAGAGEEDDTSGLEARLDRERSVLEEFLKDNRQLEGRIQKERERAQLTDFERFVADIEARKEEARKQFEEKKAQLEQEIAALEKNRSEEARIFEQKRQQYEKTEAVFVRFKERFLDGLSAMSRGAEGKIIAITERFRQLQNLIAEVGQFEPDQPNISFGGISRSSPASAGTTNNSTNVANVTVNINAGGRENMAELSDRVQEAVIRALQKQRIGSN